MSSQPFVPRLKSAAVRAITATGIANVLRPLGRNVAVVFMLHRFTDLDRDVTGHDPKTVAELLAYLRRNNYQLVGLDALLASLAGERPPLRHAVSFTIDDGYEEQATVAGPLFAAFDCPVATFVTTGFLDRRLWFWWDQIEYVFTHTQRSALALDLDDRLLRYELRDPARRRAAQDAFTELCKTVPDQRKRELISCLSEVGDVPLPERCPARYSPMTWDQLRACEHRGMTFGPHTVTHPILSRTTDERAAQEINASWSRLREEATSPLPAFAYPNGQRADFGDRELALLRAAGLSAVTGLAGFATPALYRRPNGRLLVPRFSFPDSLHGLIQVVSGLERLKLLLRGHN